MEDEVLAPYTPSSGYPLLLEYVTAGPSTGDAVGREAVGRGTFQGAEALATAVVAAPAPACELALKLFRVGLHAIASSFFVSSRILRIRAS